MKPLQVSIVPCNKRWLILYKALLTNNDVNVGPIHIMALIKEDFNIHHNSDEDLM